MHKAESKAQAGRVITTTAERAERRITTEIRSGRQECRQNW
jgi:hypothetical protein